MRKLLLTLPFVLFSGICFGDTLMNQESLEKIVKSLALNSQGEKGIVEFNFNNTKMFLISDVKHNRMRIIAPVVEYKKLSQEHLDAILESNFHKSLDARYALSEGILYSAYIHPLSELTEYQVKSAVQQVANLAQSFGKDYSSGVLVFNSKN